MSSFGNTAVSGKPPSLAFLCAGEQDHADELALLKARAGRGMSALLLRYFLVIGINLGGVIFLSRMGGPVVWGTFAIAQIVCMSGQEIFSRGGASYLIKKTGALLQSDVSSAFALQHILGLLFLCSVIVLAVPASHWYYSQELLPLLLTAAIASYAYAWRSVPLALLERELEYEKIAVIEILEAVIFTGVAMILTALGRPILGLGLGLALRSVLPTLLAFALKPDCPRLPFTRASISATTNFGLFTTGSSIVNVVAVFIPALLVGKLAGMAALGVAQMAISLYSNLLFVTAAILRLNFSAYSRLMEFPDELPKAVNRHLEFLAAALVPLIVLFAGLSRLWTPLVFGTKWQLLPELLAAQAPGYLLAAIFWGVISPAMAVSGKHRAVFIYLVSAAALYVALTSIFTVAFGALGLGIAFSTSNLITIPILLWTYSQEYVSLHSRRVFYEIVIALFFIWLLWLASDWDVLAAAAITVVYIFAWYQRCGGTLKLGYELFAPRIPLQEKY